MKRLLKSISRPFVIFYLVFIYIFAFSAWWSYLLWNKNSIAFKENVELKAIQNYYEKHTTKEAYYQSPEYQSLYAEYERQRIMIITEGMTFLVLVIVGFLMVRRSFMREIDLAQQQRNFLLSITHELKSPLASVKLALQTLMRHNLDLAKKERLMDNSLHDLDRLEDLVNNILFAAKIDSPNYGYATERLPLSEIVERLVRKLKNSVDPHVKVTANIDQAIFFEGDKIGLTSVFINLMENAKKYTPSSLGSEIAISLKASADSIIFTVGDNGIGISPEEKRKIFDKFYRVGNENTRKTKGTGLGLFIVKRVVELHGGKIRVKDQDPTGTLFTVTFPVKRAAALQSSFSVSS